MYTKSNANDQKNEVLKRKQFSISVISEKDIIAKKKIGSANMLLSQIPTLLSASQLSNAYKIIIPPGAIGELLKLKNGLLSTTMTNAGQFSAQAGLQSMSTLASPLAVFSVISMITGQYFMAQINTSIKSLINEIKELQRQITIKEESIIYSNSIFLQEIQNDWQEILTSPDYKVSIMSNIIAAVNDLTSSCYYFENMLIDELNEFKEKQINKKFDINSLNSKIQKTQIFLRQAFEIRSCFKLLLIFFTNTITKNNEKYLKNKINDEINYIFEATIKQINYTVDELIEYVIKNATNLKLQEDLKTMHSTLKTIKEMATKTYNNEIVLKLTESISDISKLDSEGREFYLLNGDLYV